MSRALLLRERADVDRAIEIIDRMLLGDIDEDEGRKMLQELYAIQARMVIAMMLESAK